MTTHELLTAATPRPWKLDDGSASRALIYGAVKEHIARTLVCEIDTSWESDAAAAEANADAQLIVRAVNEHQALLEVEASLRAVVDFIGGRYGQHARGALAHLDEVRRSA